MCPELPHVPNYPALPYKTQYVVRDEECLETREYSTSNRMSKFAFYLSMQAEAGHYLEYVGGLVEGVIEQLVQLLH